MTSVSTAFGDVLVTWFPVLSMIVTVAIVVAVAVFVLRLARRER